MIYSKQKNFIFLRVPKTASTSLQHQIIESLSDDEVSNQTHILLERGIPIIPYKKPIHAIPLCVSNPHPNLTYLLNKKMISVEELSTLNVYGVIREPVDRIISCAQHFSHKKSIDKTLTNDRAVEIFLNHKNNDKILILDKPQTFWLKHNNKPINKIFRFDRINNLLKELCGEDCVKYNHRSEIRVDKRNQLSNSLRLEIIKRYSEDFDLWESLQY